MTHSRHHHQVQHVLEHGRPQDRKEIVETVKRSVLTMSCHKFASNVVEKALAVSTLEERRQLLSCILGGERDPNPPLLAMVKDRYMP